jgi:branched-chain amino acid transport system permease protein
VLSLDLVTGYCGVATLGHAAQFGVGAYAAGIACVRGIADPVALLAVGVFAGTIMGLISGALITRFRGLPQLVLSIAVGQLVAALANKLSWLTGGSDGLSGITPGKVFGIFNFDMYSRTAFLFSLGVLVIVFVLLQRFVRSPFGLMCRGIKDDDLRARMIGVSIYPRLVLMYGVAGAVAGVGGALTAISTGVVGLDSVSFERSAEVLVMLVLGGAGHLWGALAGTIIFMIFEHIVAAANPFHWMTLVGLLLILIVIFAPRGLIEPVLALFARLKRKGSAA